LYPRCAPPPDARVHSQWHSHLPLTSVTTRHCEVIHPDRLNTQPPLYKYRARATYAD